MIQKGQGLPVPVLDTDTLHPVSPATRPFRCRQEYASVVAPGRRLYRTSRSHGSPTRTSPPSPSAPDPREAFRGLSLAEVPEVWGVLPPRLTRRPSPGLLFSRTPDLGHSGVRSHRLHRDPRDPVDPPRRQVDSPPSPVQSGAIVCSNLPTQIGVEESYSSLRLSDTGTGTGVGIGGGPVTSGRTPVTLGGLHSPSLP